MCISIKPHFARLLSLGSILLCSYIFPHLLKSTHYHYRKLKHIFHFAPSYHTPSHKRTLTQTACLMCLKLQFAQNAYVDKTKPSHTMDKPAKCHYCERYCTLHYKYKWFFLASTVARCVQTITKTISLADQLSAEVSMQAEAAAATTYRWPNVPWPSARDVQDCLPKKCKIFTCLLGKGAERASSWVTVASLFSNRCV